MLDISRRRVVNEKGKSLGKVSHVLFHPERSEVVGFAIEPPRILYVYDRNERYLALDRTRTVDGQLLVEGSAAWGKQAAKRLGISWDDSVIWMGMPARTAGGVKLGTVRDALYDPKSGVLEAVGLTGGVTTDMALGVRDLPARLVVGFNGDQIVIADEAVEVDTTGGAAAAAGKGAAIATAKAADAGKKAAEAAAVAAAYGSAAVKVAAKSETGKKVGGWLKALKDEVVDAMGDPDDE